MLSAGPSLSRRLTRPTTGQRGGGDRPPSTLMKNQTKLTDDQVASVITALADTAATVASEARRLGVARSTLRDAIERFEREATERHEPGVEPAEDGALTVTSEPLTVAGVELTEDALLRRYGLDPAEHEVVRKRINFWGSDYDPHFQLRLDAIPKSLLFQPIDPGVWTPPPPPRPMKPGEYLDAVVISDHHAPFHEKEFHRLFLEMLAEEQPGLIEVNGDLLDFATISKHREREGQVADVNACLQAGFEILADYRAVCPDAVIRFKRGNHSERLRNLIVDQAKGLHKITPAGSSLEALSLRRLLRLDDLHVEYIDEPWDQAKTVLSPKLTARHGVSTTKGAGEAMLDRLRGSTVQGHDHRAGITLRTDYTEDPDDPISVRMAMQGGCACVIPGGLGYVLGGEPNWQNAYGAFRIYPDGDFHGSLGIYVAGRLLAHNQKRYVA